MVGSSIVSEGDRVQNNNDLPIGVQGAYNLPLVYETLTTITDACWPGAGGMPPTGAAGEDTRQLADDKTARCDGVFEVDFSQISGCSTSDTYTAGDEVPYIHFAFNVGAVLRNIHCIDPAGNVNPRTPLCTSSGTQGYFKIVTEMAMETGSSAGGYQFQVNTLGTNAAAGTYLLDWLRTPLMQMYYLTDPSANYQDVALILHG